MTRPRDARGRLAPRYLPAPDWTLLRIGVDQIAADPEPLTRQVLPPRKAPTAPRGLEWTVGLGELGETCLSGILGAVLALPLIVALVLLGR